MLSIGLAGCGPEGPSKADTGMVVGAVAGGILGNQVGKGGGNVAATAIGAVVGGIVGSEIGRSMDEQDRRYAQEAEFEALERGQLVMDQERHTCTWKGEPVTLTVTEFLILHSLAQRPGVVKSRDALMDSAYDEQVYVDDRTIDSHIKRLRKKFKAVDEDFEMIETLYGVGYRFREA